MFKPCLDLELKSYRTQAWHTTQNHPKFEGVTINTNPHWKRFIPFKMEDNTGNLMYQKWAGFQIRVNMLQ